VRNRGWWECSPQQAQSLAARTAFSTTSVFMVQGRRSCRPVAETAMSSRLGSGTRTRWGAVVESHGGSRTCTSARPTLRGRALQLRSVVFLVTVRPRFDGVRTPCQTCTGVDRARSRALGSGCGVESRPPGGVGHEPIGNSLRFHARVSWRRDDQRWAEDRGGSVPRAIRRR
jgi:hypothetical protein